MLSPDFPYLLHAHLKDKTGCRDLSLPGAQRMFSSQFTYQWQQLRTELYTLS